MQSKRPAISAIRVALLTAAGPWSGVEVHTFQLASALTEKGHDVVIVELARRCYADAPLPLPCSVINLDLGSGSPDDVPLDSLGFMSWWRVLGRIQADVAIGVKGNFKFGSLPMEAAARLRFSRFLVIEHMHAPLSERPKGHHFRGLLPNFGLWWYRQKLSGYLRSIFPHRVICVSHAVVSTLEKDYGYPPSKLVAVHNGVDTALFAPNPLLRDSARKSWGIPESAFVFGMVGRISPMKNHGQLISAFSKLCESKKGRDIRLVIVGDGPVRPSLQEVARSSDLQERILFVGFSESPWEMYPGFDVLCFPSTTGESLPLVLLEAMSCQCPVIATAVGGIPEILNDPRVGWLIPSGEESALLSAMRLAIELEHERLNELGANAREHVVRNFNAGDRLGEFVRMIEAAV